MITVALIHSRGRGACSRLGTCIGWLVFTRGSCCVFLLALSFLFRIIVAGFSLIICLGIFRFFRIAASRLVGHIPLLSLQSLAHITRKALAPSRNSLLQFLLKHVLSHVFLCFTLNLGILFLLPLELFLDQKKFLLQSNIVICG